MIGFKTRHADCRMIKFISFGSNFFHSAKVLATTIYELGKALFIVHIWHDLKVKKRAKIRNGYNQAPHLTQDTIEKVTTSHLDITNESQAGFLREKKTWLA